MMQLPNPLFLMRIAKSYLSERDRIFNIDNQKLKKYQDKAFKKMVKYAYHVPLYNKKFKKEGINPIEIKGIEDLDKFPLISKQDVQEHYPLGIIPKGSKPDNFWRLNTSGTTGEHFSIFRDLYSISREEIIAMRHMKLNNFNFFKDKITLIGSHDTPGRYDYAVQNGMFAKIRCLIPLKNVQYIGYFLSDTDTKIKQINNFNPKYIFGFPDDIYKLALYKERGSLKISPKIVATSGGDFDIKSRDFIENIFDVRVCDIYSSVELGTGAFQCEYGNYHINEDVAYFEFLDDENNKIESGKPAHLVITKFFGEGTPLIRYTGLNDILTPDFKKCSCGLNTKIISQIVGRKTSRISLPNGDFVTSYALNACLHQLLHRFNFFDIKQSKIIQEHKDKIILQLSFNDKMNDNTPLINNLFEEIRKEYQRILDYQMDVSVLKVDNIESKTNFVSKDFN
jgi:phenylacetate-CoA ligase